jgi:hydrogenase 3 maturation protease
MSSATNGCGIRAILRRRLRGTIVIVGVGNTLRSDDGAGPRLVRMLEARLDRVNAPVRRLHLIDCQETPENYMGSIVRLQPDTIIVVDSGTLGMSSGEMGILEANDLTGQNPSTHRIPQALLLNRLKEETRADVFMVAIQPATTGFGEGLSARVDGAVAELSELIEALVR